MCCKHFSIVLSYLYSPESETDTPITLLREGQDPEKRYQARKRPLGSSQVHTINTISEELLSNIRRHEELRGYQVCFLEFYYFKHIAIAIWKIS